MESAQMLGKSLADILPGDSLNILKSIEGRIEPTVPTLIRNKRWGTWMTCVAHVQEPFTIIELELLPSVEVEIPSVKFVRERREPLDVYLSYIAKNFRMATKYDRVLVYRFASDWHGEVVAESLGPDMHSFLGHHFPASDIPVPARNIFLKNLVRLIADVDSKPTPILGKSEHKLDLSRSVLRAPASIHLEYLRNMGVQASLTLSIISDGKLWGLIACHHMTPKYLTPEQRSICGLLAKLVSSRLSTLITAESMVAARTITKFVAGMSKTFSEGQLLDYIRDHKRDLLNYLIADGFFYASTAELVCDGQTPSGPQFKQILATLEETNLDFVQSDAVGKVFPALAPLASVAAGIMAFKVGTFWCVWTKQEYISTITWAGNPNKPMNQEDRHERLSPRNSFNSWSEDVKGTSSAWEHHEVRAANRLQVEIIRNLEGKQLQDEEPGVEDELVKSIKMQAQDLQAQFKIDELQDLQNL